jgi:hypothetical protein
MMRPVAIRISKRVELGMERPASVPNVAGKFLKFTFKHVKDARWPGI